MTLHEGSKFAERDETAGAETHGTLEGSAEVANDSHRTPSEEIVSVLGELEKTDEALASARIAASETTARLNSIRSDLGGPQSEARPFLGSEVDGERIKRLEIERESLLQQKENWVRDHGRQNLPEGEGIGIIDGVREARGQLFEPRSNRVLAERGSQTEVEFRQSAYKELKIRTLVDFVRTMQGDNRTKTALNLRWAVELMRVRAAEAMDRKSRDFISGRTNQPPFTAVWAQWNVNSLFQTMLGKPNTITELAICFDEERVTIADERDLTEDLAAKRSAAIEESGRTE